LLAFCLNLNDKQLLKNLWRKGKTLILNSKSLYEVSSLFNKGKQNPTKPCNKTNIQQV